MQTATQTIGSHRGRGRKGLTVIAAALALASPGWAAPAANDPAIDAIGGLADRAGIAVTMIGKPPPLVSSDAPDAKSALDRLRVGDRIEVFAPGGQLQKLVMVAPGEGGAVSIPSKRGLASRVTTDEEEISTAEAIRLARDRSLSYADRQKAMAVLAQSGSYEAVDALKEIAEEGGAMSRAAITALGGFAETPAAEAAQQALVSIEAGDPMDKLRARGAHDTTVLTEALSEGGLNTLERIQVVNAATNSKSGPQELTDFYLAALQDPSASVRVAAALGTVREGQDRLDARVLSALADMATNDATQRGSETGSIAYRLLSERQNFGPGPPAPDLPRRLPDPILFDPSSETGGETGIEQGGQPGPGIEQGGS